MAKLSDVATTILRFAERLAKPFIDVTVRLWLAQMLFVSAIVKLANWSNALYLSAHEYPVSWMDPITAAYLGVSIELFGAVLLAVGLATRFAALAALALVITIQTNYLALDLNLLQAALLSWLVVHGAGPFSLDRLLSRGLADSAVPLAAQTQAGLARLTRTVAPLYAWLLRLWVATAIVAASRAVTITQMRHWLPVVSASQFVTPIAAILATLIVVGIGARFAAVGLIMVSVVIRMTAGSDQPYVAWVFLLALLTLSGPGPISLDALIERKLRARFPQLVGKPAFSLEGLPRVVIVGAGFGGLACASGLSRARVSVTLIDQHNYHLFQPLLYQIATASLSPGDIAAPIRGFFRDGFNVRVLLGEAIGVDLQSKTVLLRNQRISYDYLVLATGAAHSYFGRNDWAPFAPGLKRVEDAIEIRRRLLTAFELAEATEEAHERESLLTFLIVGGGPTGVELAGAIAELAHWGMEKDFRRFDPAKSRIILVQAGPRLLPTFPEDLSENSRAALERLGVEVRVNSRVEDIDDRGVTVNGQHIPSRTVLWAAGVVASPAAKWLEADADAVGRVKVGSDLAVPGQPDVFVIGDTAASDAWQGKQLPGLAPAAKQAGVHVAKLIRSRVEGRADPGPFVYRHLGNLATIGRKAAVVDLGWIRLRGTAAWWFWGAVHVGFLVDLRSRLSVVFDWFWAYLTYRSGTRLITGTDSMRGPVAS